MFVYAKDCPEEVLENGSRRQIIGHTDALMVVKFTFMKGQVGALHTHLHQQCGYVVKGSFDGVVDGEKGVLRAGDCYYARGGVLHGMTALEDDSVLLDVFTPMREDFLK